MRVAIIHSFYSSSLASGENQVVQDQVRHLTEGGVQVGVVGPHTDELAKSGLYKFQAGMNVLTRRGISPADQLASWKPDVVHIHNTFPNVATRWLPKWRGPVIMSFHNYRSVCSNGTFFRSGRVCHDCLSGFGSSMAAVAHACYRNSRMASLPVAMSRTGFKRDISSGNVVGVSTSIGSHEILRQILPPVIPLKMISNFVDDRPLQQAGARDPVWLSVGRMSPEKGFLSLVVDWPENQRLRIVGDGPEYGRVAEIAAMRPNIEIQRSVSRDELRALMARHLGLIFPSRWHEVAPQVVAEAMCAGLPIVANGGNVVAQMVRSAHAGATYSDQQQLSQALAKVVHDHAKMSAAARGYYEAHLTPDLWLKSMLSLYEETALAFQRHGNLFGKTLA